jgi:hypothetical protein
MATTAIQVCDQATPGGVVRRFRLELASERLTVRELILRRVTQEVEDYNRSLPEVYAGLVQPLEAEQVLNGYRLHKPRTLDARKQGERALEAFVRNGFLLLVGGRQLSDLEEWIVLTPDVEVRFLKLVPIVGG